VDLDDAVGTYMKVLMLSEPSYPRHPGGAGKCTHVLAAGLVARGHEVHILCECREETERELIDGVQVHRVRLPDPGARSRSEKERMYADRMLEYLEREVRPAVFDLVHDSGGFLSYFFRVALALREQHGIPLVLHFRYLISRHLAVSSQSNFSAFGSEMLGFDALIDELNQSVPVRFADSVICPSSGDAEYVQGAFRPAGGRPWVVPDPVYLWEDLPPRENATLGPSRAGRVLFGGRIDSELKGGEVVVEAMERLRSRHPGLRLVLLGKKQEDFQPFQRRLGDMVLPLGWISEARELAGTLAAMDVVVIPSLYESFGMMCAESLAAGTPVIAAPEGGMSDMVRHGDTGFLLTSGRPGTWGQETAGYIEALLSDPEAARSMGARARVFAKENLSVGRIAAHVERLYLAVLDGRGTAAGKGLRVPGLDAAGRARYLELLERLGGSGARDAGEAFLPRWVEDAAQRCLTCTRKKVAEDTRHLLALRRAPFAPWSVSGADRRRAVVEAVEATCPLALLEKDHLMRLLYGDSYRI
jgi:glycosyltransferase involved in cell wall biosynthesis